MRRVLDTARLGRPLPPSSLTDLTLFQQYVHEQLDSVPVPTKTVRDFLLIELLNRYIQDGLARHRGSFGRSAPELRAPLQAALADLEADFRAEAPELEAWSLLYFRYVRVDLALSLEQIAAVTAQHKRTLRRRRRRGMLRLAHMLIEAELASRRRGG